MAGTNTNPIGNPKSKETKREEFVTQETPSGLEIPVPTRQHFEGLLERAAKKQPQASSSGPG
jgi:hypothetical protein